MEKAIHADPAILQVDGRKLIEAYQHLPKPEISKALALLEKIGTKHSNVDDQVWALTKRMELLAGQPGLINEAITQAKAVCETIKEHEPAGRLLTAIGRAEFELYRISEAEQDLVAARKQFVAHHFDDGRAALLLGKIAQVKNELDRAKGFYEEVITSHAGTTIFAAGRFGRAEILALQGATDSSMDNDYHFAIREILSPENKRPPEMLTAEAIHAALAEHIQEFQRAGKLETALHFIQLQRLLKEPDTAEMVFREAEIYERRGDELMAEASALPPGSAHDEKYQAALDHYAAAADSYMRHTNMAIMQSDVSGQSLWKAATLFDKAGQSEKSLAAYQKFIHYYPTDAQLPEAILHVGQLYQSLGQFEKAIPYYQRNLADHPNTTPSYMSSVQLARCYIAQGDQFYPQAEQTLLGVVQDNKTLEPSAAEFRDSIFALGELYYRGGRWSDAILRLEEAITRYPDDVAITRIRFWLANSYRKSAAAIADAIAKNPNIAQRESLELARHDRLIKAGAIFTQLVNTLDDPEHGGQNLSTIDQDYLRFSYLYRADGADYDQY